MSDGLIIVGASHAGVQLAAKARELGYQEPITLINGEAEPPYQKPPLSKAYLLNKITEADLALKSPAFYINARIDLLNGRRCLSIDRAAKSVRLDDGKQLSYDRLVLATGARARTLPESFGEIPKGVLSLRDIADAKFVRFAATEAKRVVVVGGGFIGLEVASALREFGAEVHVIESQARLLARSCSTTASEAIARLHRDAGIQLHLETGLTQIHTRNGHVSSVSLTSGETLVADLLLFGIGAMPNVELAAAAGLRCENGIVVDQYCRTEDPNILAIGDCSSFPSIHLGTAIRLECIQNAHEQAAAAAATLVGKDTPYLNVPWFWSDQHDFKFQMVGMLNRVDRTICRGSTDKNLSLWHFGDSKLVAVETISRPGEHLLARQLLSRGNTLTPEQAADPAFELKGSLRAA